MFLIKPIGVLFGSLLLTMVIHPVAAHAQHHDAAHPHLAQPVPPPAQRWRADADLRGGMRRIHTALEELRHYEMGHMDATLALDRVSLIEQAATDIFARCKLTPEKDAALHGMLAPLLGAAREFKDDPRDVAQIAAMRRAVAGYPRYFDDPDRAVRTRH